MIQSSERLPPHSVESEQGVLGCILLSPTSCLEECRVGLQGGPDSFYDLRNRILYQTMVELAESNGVIDTITLQQRLKDKKELQNVGGVAYFAPLPDLIPSSNHLPHYIAIVNEKYWLRKMLATCTDIVGRVYDCEGQMDEILIEAERGLLQIATRNPKKKATKTEVINSALDDWETAFKNPGKLTGVPTGLIDLDKLTYGWQAENLIIIGARPSQGKTSMVLGFARAAMDAGMTTLFITLESSEKELIKRMACQIAKANQSHLRGGVASDREMRNLLPAVDKIKNGCIYFDDCTGMTIAHVQSQIRAYHKAFGIKLVIVDYLQKIKPDEKKEKRTYEVAQSSEGLKAVAKELGVPIIAAAQVSREQEKQKGRLPILSDLADCGQIERDADIVGLIYKNQEKDGTITYSLILAKYRDGPTDIVDLAFLPSCACFESKAKI